MGLAGERLGRGEQRGPLEREGPAGRHGRGIRRPAAGIRLRIAIAVVALVGLTATVLGVGASAFVESSLRDQLRADAVRQADYDLGVLIPTALPGGIDRGSLTASGLLETFRLRGDVETIVDFGDGDPVVSAFDLAGTLAGLPADLGPIVDRGEIGYAWTTIAGRSSLILAGRPAAAAPAPAFYFVHDASAIERALGQLRLALLVGALVLVGIAVATARAVARGILRPIDAAGRAAARIADGELDARVPAIARDEFGTWATEFNRMAATLEATIERLRAAESRNRRFVADVAHELRTPLTGLVAEASLLRDELGTLPADARRAAELLVVDVARMRSLVDDLLEISRFDASAEQVRTERIDLGPRLRALAAARLPTARLVLPDGPVVVETDPRRVDRIVGNLLDNARLHAPGAPVSLTLARGAGGVTVTVADAGPGAGSTGADLERLFERFAKVDPARSGGSGLGLAIAREHATLLGGSLRAMPNPGGGLRFDLRLSVTEPLPAGDAGVIDDRQSEPRSEPAGSPPR